MKSISFASLTNFLIVLITSTFAYGQVDSSKVSITRFDKVPTTTRVNNIYIDDRNIIWLASSDGLIETNGDGSKYHTHFANTEIKDVILDKKYNVWTASENTIFNLKSKVSYPIPTSAKIKDITYLNGSLWIATDNGLYEFITATNKYKLHNDKNSKMHSNVVNFVHADRHGILWVGTDGGYLRIDGDKWELQDKKYKMFATCENNEGQWIISNKDMFLINQYNRLFPVKLDPSQYSGKINNFVLDSKGRIYIASDILVRYDPYKEIIENYSADASTLSKAALSLGCDRNDNIWIGTDGAGFYKLLFGDIAAEQLNADIIVETPLTCAGGKNGAIKVITSGGNKPFTYKWNKPNLKGPNVSSLTAGSYEVTITDKNHAEAVAYITLDEPAPIKIDLIANNRVTTPENPDGYIEVEVSGGAGNFTFSWSNGKTTQNLSNASSGVYSLNVKDRNGCMVTASYQIKREKYIPDLDITKISIGQKLRINELNFEADSDSITQANYDVLDEVFEFLEKNQSVTIEIGGHTNTIPPHEYCDKLSTDRAKNVAEHLYDRGIATNRITYKGYGKREPLTDSTSAQGRQRNQRVEIKILAI